MEKSQQPQLPQSTNSILRYYHFKSLSEYLSRKLEKFDNTKLLKQMLLIDHKVFEKAKIDMSLKLKF